MSDGFRIRWYDVFLLLAVPLVVLLGTFVHESAHALVILACGGKIASFTIIPTAHYFGRVVQDPESVRHFGAAAVIAAMIAPYIVDVAVFVTTWMLVLRRAPQRYVTARAVFAFGLATPMVDTVANYSCTFRGRGDMFYLSISGVPVHVVFPLAIGIYLLALCHVSRRIAGRGPHHIALRDLRVPVACAVIALVPLGVQPAIAGAGRSARLALTHPALDIPALLRVPPRDLLAWLHARGFADARRTPAGPDEHAWWFSAPWGTCDAREKDGRLEVLELSLEPPIPEVRALATFGFDPAVVPTFEGNGVAFNRAFPKIERVYALQRPGGVMHVWVMP